MKIILVLHFILLVSIRAFWCKDLILGKSYDAHLVWQQKADYIAIPFMKRVKEFFYASPSEKVIKGIILRDLEHTDSTAAITAGGVDFTYANIRLTSKRGESLNYQMEIYV